MGKLVRRVSSVSMGVVVIEGSPWERFMAGDSRGGLILTAQNSLELRAGEATWC